MTEFEQMYDIELAEWLEDLTELNKEKAAAIQAAQDRAASNSGNHNPPRHRRRTRR